MLISRRCTHEAMVAPQAPLSDPEDAMGRPMDNARLPWKPAPVSRTIREIGVSGEASSL